MKVDMTDKNLLSRIVSRLTSHTASPAESGRATMPAFPKTFLTATDVVRLTADSLVATKFVSDAAGGQPAAWLRLWLTQDVAGDGQKDGGELIVIRVTRNNATIDLGLFQPTEAELARTAFKGFQDQLLAELVPDMARHLGGAGISIATEGASAAPTPAPRLKSSSWVRTPALLLAGACMAYLVAAFIMGGSPPVAPMPAQAASNDGGLGGVVGSLPPEMDSAANKAWGTLTKEQQIALIDVAQRSLVAAATGGAAATATAADSAASSTSAIAVSEAETKRASPIPYTAAASSALHGVSAGGKLSAADFKRLAGATKIVTRPGSAVFYAFVDPMCPSCQDLDGKVAGLDKKYGMVTVPVAFQHGARDQAAAALCAKNKVDAWALAMRVQPIGNKPCDEGYKQIDANNALFLSLGFDATPVLMAPNLTLAKGSAETSQIAGWIDANLK